MSSDGRARKRNILSGGPTRPKKTKKSDAEDSLDCSVVADSLIPDSVRESCDTQPSSTMRTTRSQKSEASQPIIPDSLVLPLSRSKRSLERQGTPFTTMQKSRKEKIPHEVIPDSIAEEEDEVEVIVPKKTQNKRTTKQAGLDAGLGEALKAVKKIKLSTPIPNDLSLILRSSPPGKRFQKARQGSFYYGQATQKISVNNMSTWNGMG